MGVEKAELKTMQEAQWADPILTKYFNLPKAELTHKGMQDSPQEVWYKLMDGE